VYDEQGRLLGEYSPEGKLIAETIWLDDLPVATIWPKSSNNQLPLGIAGTGASMANNAGNNTSTNPVNVELYYLHPDHLGTPRVATRSTEVNGATSGPNAINKAVWRWDSDPFGTSLGNSKPNENPQNVTGTASQITAASFRVNTRFPGQLADAESGKYYNYFRDYDSSIGRYPESDPIGLRGGLSTFGYVFGNPLKLVDANGTLAMSPVDPGGPGWPTFPGSQNSNNTCGLFSKGRGECLAMCMLEGVPGCAAIGMGTGTIAASMYAGAAACFAPLLALPIFVVVEAGVGLVTSLTCSSLMRQKCLRQCPDRCGASQ